MRKIIPILTFVFMGTAYADNCENPRNTYDQVYCTNKIFHSADQELNKSYKDLRTYLTTEQKTILKRSQIAWIRERDAQCSSDEKGEVNVQCKTQQTIERNAWLRERVRECQTVGCQTQRLYGN